MRTGFTNAFVNKPLTKYYSYHGIIMPCNVQPNPDPFEDFPNTYTECVWELWKEKDIHSSGNTWIRYGRDDFFPSSDNDPCADKHSDGMARYYYAQVHKVKYPTSSGNVIFYSNGLDCGLASWSTPDDPLDKAWFNRLWAGSSAVLGVNPSGWGTWIKIWRTVCGEFCGNWPVPPE